MKTQVALIAVGLIMLCGFQANTRAAEEPESSKPKTGVRVGKGAVISAVRFACGAWAEVTDRTCPVAAKGGQPKIAVYALKLNKDVIRLAVAVDREIKRDPALKWSFVEVIDWKRPTSGSQEERQAERLLRLKDISKLAKENKIERLTIGQAVGGLERESERIGVSKEADVLVAFINRFQGSSRRVLYAQRLKSSELTDEKIRELLAEIQAKRK